MIRTSLRAVATGGGGRALLFVAGCSVAALHLFACADGEETPESTLRDDGGATVPVDAARADDILDGSADGHVEATDAGDAGEAGVDPCTVDWCQTPLPIPDGGTLSLMDVWVPGPNDAWAVSAEGLVLRWNGTLWSIVWDAGKPLYGIWGDHEGALWAVGGQGAIFHAPGGTGWAEIPSGVTTDLMSICEGARDAEQPRNITIGGFSGTLLRWNGDTGEDGTPSWTTSTPGPLLDVYHVSCAGSDVWVSGLSRSTPFGGAVFVGSDAGWERQTLINDAEFNGNYQAADIFSSVWAHDRQNVWARGNLGIVRGTASAADPVLKWSRERSLMTAGVKRASDIWGTGPNDVWFVSTLGRVHHWDGTTLAITATTNTWDVLPNNLHAVSGSGPDDVWVVGDDVALHRNVNKGAQK